MPWNGKVSQRTEKAITEPGGFPAERMKKMKYKVGDRVRYLECSFAVQRGEMGVVKGFMPHSNIIAIELDHEVSFHDCHGMTRPKHGWWVKEESIELIKPAEHEFKLIIVSKGDTTTAKLLHGKTIEKEATVTRYHEDEYSEKAAVEAVVKKLFGEDEKKEAKPKYFTGKAVWVGENTRWHTKGKIYVFENGIHIYDDGTESLTSYAEDEMPQGSGFLPIVE